MNEPGPARQAPEPERQRLDERPRYAGAADYVRLLNRYKVLIAAITIAFGAAAFLYSVTRTETYKAQAQLSFGDVLAGVDLRGLRPAAPGLQPVHRLFRDTDLITHPEVTREARRRLDTDLSLEELAPSVTARIGAGTQANLVIVEARAADANVAADLANAYAQAARIVGGERELDRVREVRRAATSEIEAIRDDDASESLVIRLAALEELRSMLGTVAEEGEPAQIVRRAVVPAGPDSPRTGRDVALGGMVGLIFGLLAAFGRASLDRRVHTAEEVLDELGAPVLTRVSETALGCAGLASNGQSPMMESDFESFRLLRTNLAALRSDPPPRSVLVTSALAEEGKSTVSMALASAAAIAGQRVLLVECDLRRPAFERRLGVSRTPGLTDYLLGTGGPREILQTVELSQPTTVNGASATGPGSSATLVCITAGKPVPNPAELLITDRFRGFLEKVTRAYDLVILDSSPLLASVDPLELIPQVGAAIVCVRARRTTLDQLRAARAALAKLPERPVGAVLTGVRRGGPDSYDYYHGY